MLEMCFEDLDLEYLASARHFHLSSYFLHRALRPRIPELFRRMKEAGLTTSLDTNDDPDDRWDIDPGEVLRDVDILLPNEREVKKFAGIEDLEEAIEKVARLVPVLAVKLGRLGATARRGAERITLPPFKVDAIDPVGAGDSFDAGFLHQYIRGASLETCVAYGNLAGGFSTTRPGGTEAFRDREYCRRFFAANWPAGNAPPARLSRPRTVAVRPAVILSPLRQQGGTPARRRPPITAGRLRRTGMVLSTPNRPSGRERI